MLNAPAGAYSSGQPIAPTRWNIESLSPTSAAFSKGARSTSLGASGPCGQYSNSPAGPSYHQAIADAIAIRQRSKSPEDPITTSSSVGVSPRRRPRKDGASMCAGPAGCGPIRFTIAVCGRTTRAPDERRAAATKCGLCRMGSAAVKSATPSTAQRSRNHGSVVASPSVSP